MNRSTLLFVSPRFLFPVDSGGKIRTTQILRGMKGGKFRIHLVSPGSRDLAVDHRDELEAVCDRHDYWVPASSDLLRLARRALYLVHRLPMPIRCDYSSRAAAVVRAGLAQHPAIAVFDFLHAAVLAPGNAPCPTLLFTHNVESEIFRRHRDHAASPAMRLLWASQYRKMRNFEKLSLQRFDGIVAVSDRDASIFRQEFGIDRIHVIPTGVDLEYFSYTGPTRSRDVVFCGSMDWLANQDGLRHFMDDVWPAVTSRVPDARMTVVGRSPPSALIGAARSRGLRWSFTGFVDDVRPVVRGAAVSVVPLRIGGGTRLKVYESMAMGPVVVSTSIGVEGLPVDSDICRVADDPQTFADAVVSLLLDDAERNRASEAARRFVEARFSHRVAAESFERACVDAMHRSRRIDRRAS